MDKQYALDADVLISASRGFYAFDIAPAFWRQLAVNGKDRLILVDRVCQVIYAAEDQLSEWLKTNEELSQSKAPKTIRSLKLTPASWRRLRQTPSITLRKAAFAGTAESWLCARCQAHGHVVVTQESMNPKAGTK